MSLFIFYDFFSYLDIKTALQIAHFVVLLFQDKNTTNAQFLNHSTSFSTTT